MADLQNGVIPFSLTPTSGTEYIGIIGPRIGVPDGGVAAFNQMATWLREQGFVVFDPTAGSWLVTWTALNRVQHRDVVTVLSSEKIVLLPGWQVDGFASLMALLAVKLGKPLLVFDTYQRALIVYTEEAKVFLTRTAVPETFFP